MNTDRSVVFNDVLRTSWVYYDNIIRRCRFLTLNKYASILFRQIDSGGTFSLMQFVCDDGRPSEHNFYVIIISQFSF